MRLSFLSSPGIRVRLGAAFAVLVVLSLANAALALRHAEGVHERLESVYAREMLAMKALDERRLGMHRADRALRAGTEAARRELRLNATELTAWAAHRASSEASGPAERKLAGRLREAAAQLARAAEPGEGAGRDEAFDAVDALLAQLSEIVKNNAETHYEYAKAEQARAQGVGAAGAWALGIAGLLLALWIVRGISARLDEAVALAQRVASGDLSGDAPGARRDEIGRLVSAMGSMVERLIDMLGGVRDGTRAIRQAAADVSRGGHELAGRGERQVRRAEELAAVAGELAATARTNHERATHAAQSASAADAFAAAGAAGAADLRECIRDLHAGASRIADIVGVIGRVASKTSLIALNAAVEAAHAGHNGRGFAVVAGEVRALAREAQHEATRINGIVAEDLRRIAQAQQHVEALNGAIGRVRESAAALASGMQEIIRASAVQAEAVARMSEFADAARRDVALDAQLAERSVATVAELSEQASRLAGLLEDFRLPDSPVAAVFEPVALLPVRVPT